MGKQSQCRNQALEGSSYCAAHGGNKAVQSAEKASLNNYRLNKFNVRLQQLSTSPGIKSLRDEIAILRIMMEERLNMCNGAVDLMLHSHSISDLVMKIDKVVNSCHKLESNMGALLDKQDIIQFGGELINIIGNHITDEDILTALSNEIISAVARSTNVEEE